MTGTAASLRALLDAGARFGADGTTRPERILLEFVSANPTGPIVAASGRHAAYGDSLGRILEFHGHTVEREYYVNDSGSQVLRLGESVRARALGQDPPEDGYQGDYVADIAAQLPGAADESLSDQRAGRPGGGRDGRGHQGNADPLRRRVRHLLQRALAA